jgi:adenine-specific DNA-methyltransferase
VRGDAVQLAGELGPFDFAYLDPPYNQHRYEANYHIWETLVAWDEPDVYGVACKRVDVRDAGGVSPFNRKRLMPAALAATITAIDAGLLVLSFSDEGWIGLDGLVEMCAVRGRVEVLPFGSRRYVGAEIGIHNQRGERVGTVSHTHNTEYLLLAGDLPLVRRVLNRRVLRPNPG